MSMALVLIITLMAVALNISNDSINQLTGEERKAVIAVDIEDSNIYLQMLGEEYEFSEPVERSSQLFDDYCSSIRNYLLNIWIIFDTVFLQH